MKRSDWDAVEAQSRNFLTYLESTARSEFDARLIAVLERNQRMVDSGVRMPAELGLMIQELTHPTPDRSWTAGVEALVAVDRALHEAEGEFVDQLRTQAEILAEWAGLPAELATDFENRVKLALQPIADGDIAKGLNDLTSLVSTALPHAVERRQAAQETGGALVQIARELGVPTGPLDASLVADAEAGALSWPQSVGTVEAAEKEISNALRERVVNAVQSMRTTLASLKDLSVDPADAIVRVEELLGEIPTAGPADLARILTEARSVTEEPVVAIVAGLLDEARPKLVEVRRLGRDPNEVFAAMNRAREALRLKVYSEALAAAQEAVDRVLQLTEDLDSARDELASLEQLLQRLTAARAPVDSLHASLDEARRHLEQMEIEAARGLLQQTVEQAGTQAFEHFSGVLQRLESIGRTAEEAGFLSPEAGADLGRARSMLESGDLTAVGELLSNIEVRLRTAAGPYVTRRVEELQKGFEELKDETLVAPVRRSLADADVNLRVKGDLSGSLESLKRAERDFSSIFAAHASALVETLEDERRGLEAMGGPGDEIQRQIDEVQQIYNMGDFVKASRASQEIRQRARQQQLVRSEEAISHAKLALVEVGKMGLDNSALRESLEAAQAAAQEQRYAEAFRLASDTERQASQIEADAQSVVEALGEATDHWQALKRAGVKVDDYRDRITLAQQAYQSLAFPQAKTILAELNRRLRTEEGFHDSNRLVEEATGLTEEARRLSVPAESSEEELKDIRKSISATEPEPALLRVRKVHADLVARLRPIIEENLKGLEQDLDIARAASSEIAPTLELIAEARRRAGAAVPIGVAAAIEAAHSRLTEIRGFKEQAERAMRRTQEALNEAELAHVAAAIPRKEMQRIEERFEQREYARVIERATTLERELNQLTYQHVSKTLNAFQGLLVKAREEGTDASQAENLLRQSRGALNEGRPLEALQLATRSEREMERAELQVRIAQASLDTLEQKYTRTLAEGIRAPAAADEMAKARTAFEHKDFVGVLEHVFTASDTLALSRENYRRARDALDSAEDQLADAVKYGANLDLVAPVIESARQYVAQGEYAEAMRKSREASELGRMAIEHQSAGMFEEVRQLVEIARTAGLTDGLAAIGDALQSAEIAVKSLEWSKATQSLEAAKATANRKLDELVQMRKAELDQDYSTEVPTTSAERDLHQEISQRIAVEIGGHYHLAALKLIGEERKRIQERRKIALAHLLTEIKDRLWIGERLGLDTTPVMELFSEGKLALEAGNVAPVPGVLERADQALAKLVQSRLGDKLREVRTEMDFARDGLHVIVGAIPEELTQAEELQSTGKYVAAAQMVLLAEQNLNSRKSMHRELLNIHYLIDAALSRATERHVPTDEARALLDESIQLRSTDYAAALQRARHSLAILQGLLKTPESATGFWPFKRPPT
jgi:hypothetical protein